MNKLLNGLVSWVLLGLYAKRMTNSKLFRSYRAFLIGENVAVKSCNVWFNRGRKKYMVTFFIVVKGKNRLHSGVFYTKGKMLKTLEDDNVLESVQHKLGLYAPIWNEKNSLMLCGVEIIRNRKKSKKTRKFYNAGYKVGNKNFCNLQSAFNFAYSQEILNANNPHYQESYQPYRKTGDFVGVFHRPIVWTWKGVTAKANNNVC